MAQVALALFAVGVVFGIVLALRGGFGPPPRRKKKNGGR